MISGDVTTMISGDVNSRIDGGMITTNIDGGNISTGVTIGQIVSMINGNITGSITDVSITGGINAQVMLSGYEAPTAMRPQTQLGTCVVYENVGTDPSARDGVIRTSGQCTTDGNPEDDTVTSVWTPIPNLTTPDTSMDARIASTMPVIDTDAASNSIDLSGVSTVAEVDNIMYLDAEGNVLTPVLRWEQDDSSGTFPTLTGENAANEHAICEARVAGTHTGTCTQVVQYHNGDGENTDVETTTGTISLDAGDTLSIADGTIMIDGPDSITTTIDASEITAVSTHDLTATSTHDLTVDSTHDITADSTHDITADSTHDITADSTHDITAATTTTTTTMAVTDTKMHKGSRDTHIAAQLNLGAVTGHLGYSQLETNGANAKTKVTHYGVAGGLGDTGMSFLIQARSVDAANGMDTDPWLVALTKGLGGGATVMVEHANDDDGSSGKTRFGLKVDF